MNIDAVIKRLEALEGKITGTTHIESIIIGIPGEDGNPIPCTNPETYQGQWLVLENTFVKKDKRLWVYQPRKILINRYQNYNPPTDYRNGVIYLIRRGVKPISRFAMESVSEALQAVETANNNILKGETNNETVHSYNAG